MKHIFLAFLILLLTLNTFAYTYYYPIEADNKLIIFGETSRVMCDGVICKYNYSITNNDSVNHLVNITPYLDTELKTPITTNQIIYDTITYSIDECTKYGAGLDENSKPAEICIVYKRVDKTYLQERLAEIIPKDDSKLPLTNITLDNSKFKGTVKPITTNQQTIKAGETLYFKVQFKPVNKIGELVLIAKSDSNPLIKASLDPAFNLTGLVSDFNFNETSGSTALDALVANHGVIGAGVSINQAGKIGRDYNFNGTGDGTNRFVDLNFSSSESNFDFLTSATGNWTISLWFKTSNIDRQFVTKFNDTGTRAGFSLYNDAGRPRITYWEGGTYVLFTVAQNGWNNNAWHHLVAQKTSASTLTSKSDVNIYIDGNLRTDISFATNGDGNPTLNNAYPLTIGSSGDHAGSTSYYGELDIVSIWGRTLGASEVTQLYNGGAGIEYPYDTTVPQNHIDWNVYKTGTTTHLTGINVDCNINAMDITGGNSPFASGDVNQNTVFSCNFTKLGYDSNIGIVGIADSNKTIIVYLNQAVRRITFDVNRAGTAVSLTGITVDWNVNAYDVSGQNSPFTQDVNIANYSVTFSRTGYDNNTSFFVNADVNKTYTVYMTDSTLPVSTATGCGAGWNNSDQNIAFGCSDSGSGCSATAFKIDLGAWQTTGTTLISSDGNHRVDYNSIDVAGNIETTKTTYCAVDKTAPTTSFSGCPDGWSNSNETITLSCVDTNSGCSLTQYRLNSGAWQDYTIPFELSSDSNFQVDYNSTDALSNVEATKTSYCAIDKTEPTVGATTWVGFTIFGAFIKGVGDIIGGVVDGAISGVDTTLCEYSINGGGTWLSAVWNTDHCEKIGVTISDGTIYDANTSITDFAGNTGYGTGTGQYTGDTNAPTTTDDSSATWSGTNETVTLTPNDGTGSGIQNTFYCVDETGTCTPTTNGTNVSVTCTAGNVCLQYVRYFSQDNLDNNETPHNSLLTAIDKQLPTTSFSGCGAGWNNTTQNITLTCDDGAGSSCASTSYTIDNGTVNSYSGAFAISNDGNHKIDYNSIDAVNNQEITKTNYCAVDTTAPTLTAIDNNGVWKNNDFNINFEINFSASGKSSAQFRIDAGAWQNFTTDYNVPISVDGNYSIDANFTDIANNSLILSNIRALLDRNVPVTTLSGCANGWNKNDQNITLTCTDGNSGCTLIQYRLNSGAWQNYTTPFTINTDLNHKIDYNATTGSGIKEETKTNYCQIDKTAPTYSSIDGNGVLRVLPFNLNVNGLNFNLSGKASAQYRVDGGAWGNFATDYNVPISVDGNYLIDFNFTDLANNSLLITGIDANLATLPPQNPTITIVENNSGKSFIKDLNTIPVILTLKDIDSAPLFVDLYYSTTSAVGSGSLILLNESTAGANLICADNNFFSDVNCTYNWNIASIADGNYYLSAIVSDGVLDANDATNATFEITTRTVPVSTSYVERYIAPDSKQRDTNVYFSPTSLFGLTESEKQTTTLQAIEKNILLVALIIIVIILFIAWFLWDKRR